MRRIRLAVAVGVFASGIVAAGGAPALADPTSSICSVTADYVAGTSDVVVGIQVQAFDCDDRPLPFSGDVSIAQVDDPDSMHWSVGAHTPQAHIESTDGSPAVALVDVGSLAPGQGVTDWDLTAAGDTVAAHPKNNGDARFIQLADGAFFPGYDWTGGTRTATTTPWGFMQLQRQLWGCDSVLVEQSVCVVSTRTAEDDTWQRGYKLTVTWPDPGDDALGRPYTRCRLYPRLGLFWHYSTTNPIATLGFTVNVDVPADWGSYTIPIGTGTSFPGGITPGRSSIDVDYRCYTDQGSVHGYSSMMTVHDELIPDVPPSDPTTVDVQASGDGIDADTGGSVARGAAPLQGYDMSVVRDDGAVVDFTRLTVSGAPPMIVRATAAKAGAAGAKAGLTHAFRHLAPGRYTVQVAAYNSVGSSATLTSRTITVKAPVALTSPRSVAARSVHHRLRISWTAPTRTGGTLAKYVVRITRGSRVVQTSTVRTAAHRFTSKVLHGHGTYRVRVTAVSKDGRTASTTRTVRM